MQNLKDMLPSNSKAGEHMYQDFSRYTMSMESSGSNVMHSNLSEVSHVKQLSSDIGALFKNNDFYDIKLIVDGVEFKAHKIVLAARSEYFRALLYSGMRESNSDTIEIKEAKPSAFRLLLQYIYTGKLSLRNEKEDLLIDLLTLVHQYGFIDLQRAISDYLESILDLKNVCSIFDVACLFHLKSLEETCARYIDKHCLTLTKQNSLLQLSCESIAAIISRDSFSVPEIDIFKLVKDWHDNHGLKEPRHDLIDKIRLPLMQIEELLNDVRESNLINSDMILDAIKCKTVSKQNLKYRGVLYFGENIATSRYNALVVKGEYRSELLNGDVSNYDFDRGFTYHTIEDKSQNAIVVQLGQPSIFNQIKLLLWDKDFRSYSYYIEVSMNEEEWTRVVDYSDYMCRSWQNLRFKPIVANYVKIVGTRNTANRIFHLVTLDVRYSLEQVDLVNQILVPHYNVAVENSAIVLEGVSRCRNALINGDYKNYDWDSGYTCHQLGSGSISIQLAQPYIASSMRLLLWDCDNRSYSYCIEVSLDQSNWDMVADKRNEACRSWQILMFPARPFSFIRITGTHNTANEVFHCVHFECPCDPEVLKRFLDYEPYMKESKRQIAQEQQQQQQQEQSNILKPTVTQTQQEPTPAATQQQDETKSIKEEEPTNSSLSDSQIGTLIAPLSIETDNINDAATTTTNTTTTTTSPKTTTSEKQD